MKTLLIALLLVLASTSTRAAEAERTITCDGPYRGERIGYCHLMDHITGTDSPEPQGLEKIEKAGCGEYERCVIRARVIPRGDDGQQNWTVVKVLWAKKGKR